MDGDVLTEESLRARAGERSFRAGGEYTGAIRSYQRYKDLILADVLGTERYHVTLSTKVSGAFFCSCPYHAQSGAFCKHLVAAGLMWLERVEQGVETKPEQSAEAIVTLLRGKSRDELFDILMAQVLKNSQLRHEFLDQLHIEPGEVPEFDETDW